MPKSKVYIETSVVSYVTAFPSRDLIVAAHQQITSEWWRTRDRFDLFVSEAVTEEAAGGDPGAAVLRLAALEGITILDVGPVAADLARNLVAQHALPAKAAVDALHIAIAAVNGMDFLLTWNCKHIANATTRRAIEKACRVAGFAPPLMCTPEELSEDQS